MFGYQILWSCKSIAHPALSIDNTQPQKTGGLRSLPTHELQYGHLRLEPKTKSQIIKSKASQKKTEKAIWRVE